MGAAHPGPGPVAERRRQAGLGLRGWAGSGTGGGTLGRRALVLRWAELDLTDPVNAVAEHSSSRASSKQRRWGMLGRGWMGQDP